MTSKSLYLQLKDVTDRAIDECAKRITLEDFQRAYPNLLNEQYQGKPPEKIWKMSLDFFKKNCRTQVLKSFRALNVEEHLDALQSVIANADARRERVEHPRMATEKEEIEVKAEAGTEIDVESKETPVDAPASDYPAFPDKLAPPQVVDCFLRAKRDAAIERLENEHGELVRQRADIESELAAAVAAMESQLATLVQEATRITEAAGIALPSETLQGAAVLGTEPNT